MDHGPVLPQELFDLVIDHLHDDPRSLRACAVVSTSFLPPSRVHLFSHIRIGHLDQERSIKELHTILAKSSGVAARVESLHFWDDMMRHHSWLEGNLELAPAVAHFLRILPSLQRFCITINAGFVHWANMATILRTSVYKTIVLPTLTRVELTGLYGLPFALFANCTALKSVTLKWVTFHERDNLDFAATLAACVGSPPAQLEHLSLALDARLLGLLSQWIINPQSPLDITLLKSFSCILDGPTDHVALGSLLAVCASTLETLQLKNLQSVLPNFEALIKLRTLRLHGADLRWIPLLGPHGLSLVVAIASEAEMGGWVTKPVVRSYAQLTFILGSHEERTRDLVDVSAAYAHRFPPLVEQGVLRVLRSQKFEEV